MIKLKTPQEMADKANTLKSGLNHKENKGWFAFVLADKIKAFFLSIRLDKNK